MDLWCYLPTCLLKEWAYLEAEYGYDETQIESSSYHALAKLFNISSTCIESK